MEPEERTIELKVTKRRLEAQDQEQNPGNCGPWYIKIMGGHTYTCRICYTGGPTGWPYEECIQLPD